MSAASISGLSRRDALKLAGSAGFALAVQPICAQTALVTDAAGLTVGWVDIPGRDLTLRAYRAMPAAAGRYPLILVVQEIFGIHAYIQDVCRRLAKAGYHAVAVDLYQRQGDATKAPDIKQLIEGIVSKVPDAQVMADLDAAVAWAKAEGRSDVARLGVTGFCWGGRITWLYAAHNPGVRAGVAWYGRVALPEGMAVDPLRPRQPIDVVKDLHGRLLGLYGEKDDGIPLASVEAMRAALKAAGKDATIHVYPDAPHGFHADYRPTYRKELAEDGWARLLAHFEAAL